MPRCHALHSSWPGEGLANPFFLWCFPSRQRPSFSDVQELADKGQTHTTHHGVVLFLRQPSPPLAPDSQRPVGRTACVLNNDSLRIYVPLLMRPWVVQACHSTASCHLGTARTLHMLERFDWCVDMSTGTRWWLHNSLRCQARKTSRLTARWPITTMPLSEGPGIAVSVDYFGILPATPRGINSTYILLLTDRFSRRADIFAVTADDLTAEGTANVIIDRCIPLGGCPRSILSDEGLQFFFKIFVRRLSASRGSEIAIRPCRRNGDGGVERVNHAMAQMLGMVVNELQNSCGMNR